MPPLFHALFHAVERVLRPGGKFVAIASNGDYVWHTLVGPVLGKETRHLPGDRFPRRRDVKRYAAEAGLSITMIDFWRFVPSGDMSRAVAQIMKALSTVGRGLARRRLWGGLTFCAVK
jgi:hypothetical protein